MTGNIELAADGYPVDPGLRRLADRTMARLSTLRGMQVDRTATLAGWLTPWWAREPAGLLGDGRPSTRQVDDRTKAMVAALPGLLDALSGAGHFSISGGRLSVAVPKEYAANPVPKDRMLAAFAGRMAARRVTGDDRREALARMFLKLRALHAVHGTRDGALVMTGRPSTGFLVPRGYRIDPAAGPAMAGGLLFTLGRNGTLTGRVVPPEAISVSFTAPERAVVVVDAARLLPWRKTGFKVEDLTVSALRWRVALHGDQSRIEPDWDGVTREEAAAYLGFDMGGRQWRSFRATLRRARRLSSGIGMAVHGMLDPEVRRACLRTPRAKVALANWFVEAGPAARSRRLQASAAYPALTPWLYHASAEIDAGVPLAPVLAARLGLPSLLVRELAGRHWQALGPAREKLVTTRRNAARLSYMIGAIPPERIPRTKAQWDAFLASIPILVDWLGSPKASRLTRDASQDWERTRRLDVGGLSDGLSAVGLAVRDACRHLSPPSERKLDLNDWLLHTRSVVVEAVVGHDGGLGRVRTFNERFHRQANALGMEHRRIRQESWAAEAADDPDPGGGRWLPLTRAPYVGGGGRIEWITDGADLAEEGRAMDHCVAYRERDCRFGRTHVGRVTGQGGTRSTVEFGLYGISSRSRLSGVDMVEHQAAGNTCPDPACERVVACFMEEAKSLVRPGPILAAADLYSRWVSRNQRGFLPPGPALEALRLYEGLLSPAFRGLPVEEWARRVSEALGRDACTLPDGCMLGDKPDFRMLAYPENNLGYVGCWD